MMGSNGNQQPTVIFHAQIDRFGQFPDKRPGQVLFAAIADAFVVTMRFLQDIARE